MILIADSGGTKTDWVLCDHAGVINRRHTQGINPVHQTPDEITSVLKEELSIDPLGISSVWFYGAGCDGALSVIVRDALQAVFVHAAVSLESDLLGAARALCGHKSGIAAILGTGSNSALYDGEKIIAHTPALGYVLGDEGSGAVLGRNLLNALYKGVLPKSLLSAFEEENGLTLDDIINKVYRQPVANRFLASLTPFIHRHLDEEPLREIVIDSFRMFFVQNIARYNRDDLSVNFVGGVAFAFEEELREAASRAHSHVGKVLRSPIDSLVKYHCHTK